MTHPTGNLSNEQYINGLLQADEDVIKAVSAEFGQPVARAITLMGGSEATGKVFFQTAVIEAARQARLGGNTPDAPFFYCLKTLALAHYKDWLTEREQPLPDSGPDMDEPVGGFDIPSSTALRETRQKLYAWKKGEQTEDENYPLWQKLRAAERQSSEGQSPKSKSNFARNLLIFFVLITLAYAIYEWFRSKTPAQVYDDNFAPPESLMDDLALRYGPARGNDSVSARPNKCEFLLREADNFYKSKDYDSAQAVLSEVLDDELAVCQSDALFYMGVIALVQEEPGWALECFSKIEDIEHFGEDIYWYQALAFVKLAEKNPLLREKAARAVERARSNAQDSIRRAHTQKMLEHLAE